MSGVCDNRVDGNIEIPSGGTPQDVHVFNMAGPLEKSNEPIYREFSFRGDQASHQPRKFPNLAPRGRRGSRLRDISKPGWLGVCQWHLTIQTGFTHYPVDGNPANPHTGAPPGGSPGGARPGPGPHKMYGGDGGGRFLADLVRKWTRLFILG